MAKVMGTGSYEEEMLRQQREEEERQRKLAEQQAKQAQEDAKAAEESAAEATAQTQEQAKAAQEGAKAVLGPSNRPFTEEQSFLLKQREAVRESDWDVAKVGELTKLPAELEEHRAFFEERNRKGKTIPGDLTDWGENRIVPDYKSFKDDDQAAYFASTLESEEDIKSFTKEYARTYGKDYEKTLTYFEDLLGNRLFDKPLSKTNRNKAIMNGLAGYDMIGYDGKAINVNSCSLAELERAIKSHPDKEVREELADWLVSASKQEGNRFYGADISRSDLTAFNDTAALSSDLYKEFTADIKSAFDPTPGHDEQNEEKYQELMAAIDGGEYTEYQKHYLRQAVERGYSKQLGVSHAKVGQEAAAQAVTEPAQDAPRSQPSPQGMRWIDNAPGFQKEAAEAAGPISAMDKGFEYELADVGRAQLPSEGSVNLVNDPVRAVAEYANRGLGNLLDYETRETVNKIAQSSTMAKVVFGLDWSGSDDLYAEAKDNPFALAQANEARSAYLRGDVSTVIGSTLGNYFTQIQDKAFPQELVDDAEGAILQIGLDAEAAYKANEFTYDPEKEIMYEAYVKYKPESLGTLQGVFEEVNAMKQLERDKAQQAADAAVKAEADRLAQSQAAVQTEFHTAEDINRVADAAPVVTMTEAMRDPMFNRIMQEIALDRTFSDGEEGGFYNEHAVDYMMGLGMSGDLNSVVAMEYKDNLQSFVEAELLKDERVSESLGYEDLNAYYAKQGGFKIENLYARASVEMQRFGADVTEEELETVYKGTGEDVGFLDVWGGGAAQGVVHAGSEALEAIWMMGQASVEERADAVAGTRNQYVSTYGPAIASYMYAQDILKWAAEGDFPNEEYPKYLKTYIESGLDPFQLGVVPDTSSLVLKGAVKMDKAVEAAGVWAQEHMTPEQGKNFETAGVIAGNTALQVMASTITGATGSSLLGTFASFGMSSAYPEEMRKQLSGGKSMAEANAMAMTHAATTALAEYETSGKFTNKMLQMLGLPSAMSLGATRIGKVGSAKTVSGMLKAFGKGAVMGAVEMAWGELVKDEIKDKLLWNFAGGTVDAKQSGARWIKAIANGLGNMDTGGAVSEVIGAIPEGFICMTPMIFLAGMSDGFSATKRAAQKLASTGTAEAAREFVKALNTEIDVPENQAAMDNTLEEIQVGQVAAGVLASDPEVVPIAQNAQKKQEQRQSHESELEASKERLKNDEVTFDECVASGDVEGAVAAFNDMPKAQQGINEHSREAEQAKVEEDRLFEEATGKAITKARGYVANSKRLSMQVLADRIASIEKPEDKIAELNSQMGVVGQQIIDAEESGDFELAEKLQGEFTQMIDQVGEIESGMQATDAVGEARANAEAALMQQDAKAAKALEDAADHERLAEEKSVMAPVYRDLRNRYVYVDKQQAGNIKSATGLTITQFNRKYGMKLTTDRNKAGKVSLDGSFFEELAGQAPGYINADAAHPEESIIALAERKKQLAGVKASIGTTNADAYVTDVTLGTEDPVTQKIASDLKRTTGIDLVTANLEDGVRGWYDRKNNQLVLSNKLGAGELERIVVMHELTHYIEESPDYDAYKNAVLDAAYEGDEEYRKQQIERDRKDLIEKYGEIGVSLTPDEVDYELVAAATERVITGDATFFEGLINGGKRSLVQRVYLKVKQFLGRLKAKKVGPQELARYDSVQKAHDLMEKALQSAPRGAKAEGNVQYAIVQDESNWPMVKADRRLNLGEKPSSWNDKIQKVIEDTIREHGDVQVKALDGETLYITEKSQWHAGSWPSNFSKKKYSVKVNASAHLDEVAAVSYEQKPGEQNKPDDGRHPDVAPDGWRYRTAVFEDYDGERYELGLSVGENGIVKTVYNIGKVNNIPKENNHPNSVAGSSGGVSSFETSLANTASISSGGNVIVQQDGTDVKNQTGQNGIRLSIGIRQYGNNTAQRSDFISDRVKELVKDSEYERDTNEAQVKRATERMDTLGGAEAAVASLLNKDKGAFTADDNALAFVAMAEATRNGDDTTAAMMAVRMLDESGEQGRALQSLQIALKLSPEGAMAEAVRKSDRVNEQKGIPKNSFPTGEGKKKQGGRETRADGSTAKTPEVVEKVYRDAAEVNAALTGTTGEVSYDNPWQVGLADWKMALISAYKLGGEALPGTAYNLATVKQRMLAAIIATDNGLTGDAREALIQQLEAMDRGYAVVTKADLTYIAGQMAEFRLVEGAEATVPHTQAGREALGRAFQAQDNVTQESMMTKWRALRFMNMLSAPATAVRNVSSNVLASGLENASTVIAEIFDKRISKKTGNRTTATATKAERQAANKAFAKETARTFMDYFISKVDTGHGRKYATGGQGRVFESEFLEGCRNLVDFAMQIGDRPFYEKTYAQELAIVQRLDMKVSEMKDGKIIQRSMTEDEIHQEATARALKRVFQEDNAIVSAMNMIKAKSPGMDLFISTLMPFIKTPTSIAMRAIEYSPVGLASTLLRRARFGMDSGKSYSISQRDYVMGLGRGLTGSALMAAGYALAQSGVIEFGREDEENERRRGILSAIGRPYSMHLKIGDTRHEMDWALPMSSALAMGAELFKGLDTGDGFAQSLGGAIINGVGEQIMSTPMLSAMNDIFRGYDDTQNTVMRFAKTSATSLINQTFSPAAIRALAKATDPYVRDTSSQNAVWSALSQNVVQYWPGLRQMLPINMDLTGDKQLQSGYWNPKGEHGSMMMQMLDSFFTPTATIGDKNDDALFELLDLSYRTDESSFLPSDLIAKNKYELKLNKTTAKAMKYGDDAITMTLTDEEKRSANAQHGDLLFNGDGGRRYMSEKGKAVPFPGLRAVMADKAKYSNGSYKQSKLWSQMTDEERIALVDKMRTDAKTLITVDVAKRKKEAGEL